MPILAEKTQCTGCGACAIECKANAIKMVEDSLSYLYPIVDSSRCVECGLCERKCPLKSNGVKSENSGRVCFAATHRNDDMQMKSSSGGAFSAIVDIWGQETGECEVCAAIYDDNMTVCHKLINSNSSEFEAFHGSKYVQSYLGESFKKIENDLKHKKKVLFVGAPCQVAGLKSYLGRDYDNLLLVDFMCTGAGSPRIFKIVIEHLERTRQKKIVSFNMRKKVEDATGDYSIMEHEICYEDGSAEHNRLKVNLFKKMFYKHRFYRTSCYHCSFKTSERVGDITIGDWWGSVDGIDNRFRGASAIICNTEKGVSVGDNLDQFLNLKQVLYSEIIKQQPALRCENLQDGQKEPYAGNTARKDFFYVMYMYVNAMPTMLELIKGLAKIVLPEVVAEKLRKS